MFEKLWKDTPAVKEKEDRENKKQENQKNLEKGYSYKKDLENLKKKIEKQKLFFKFWTTCPLDQKGDPHIT